MFDIYTHELNNGLVGDKLVKTVKTESEAIELLKLHNCYDLAVSENVTLYKCYGKIYREEEENNYVIYSVKDGVKHG